MKHKYVIIDSSKENHNSVDAKFKVQIPQGITGTTRVCVKSFSMPNSYPGIFFTFYCTYLMSARFWVILGCYAPVSDFARFVSRAGGNDFWRENCRRFCYFY